MLALSRKSFFFWVVVYFREVKIYKIHDDKKTLFLMGAADTFIDGSSSSRDSSVASTRDVV